MSNRRNRLIYRLWAPVYDTTVNRLFLPGRRQALACLAVCSGERVLLLGVGTGADLPLLPEGACAVGIDLSPHMLARARRKLPLAGRRVVLLRGDAQEQLVAPAAFDAAILNLILSVIPDPHACLRSALTALKPGGRLVVFDKFQSGAGRPSAARRFMNFFSTLAGTDITRCFADIADGLPCEQVAEEPSIGGGLYRVILLKKIAGGGRPETT